MTTIKTTTTTKTLRQQATALRKGSEIKTLPVGTHRFGGGLYLIVSASLTRSWQVHFHVAGKHQAAIVGRWPDLGIEEAKAKRDAIKRDVREGGDPLKDRQAKRAAALDANAATVRVVVEAWLVAAKEARGWSANYAAHTRLRIENHVLPAIGDLPIGRVTVHDVEAVVVGLMTATADRPALRSQAVHVRQALQLLFDYAMRRDLVAVNPMRKIADDLPKRVRGDEREVSRAHVATIEEARAVLRAVEATGSSPFLKLAHRLVALTAVRKLEGVEARWSELSEGAEGWTWTIPAARMKGRRGQKRAHIIPLSPQAADVFLAARALQASSGIKSDLVFTGNSGDGSIARSSLNDVYDRALPAVGLAGRHTVHGWRATFSTISNEADPTAYRVIDVMLAHKAFGEVEARYNKATFVAERRKLARAWADQLLLDAPSAFALAGIEASNSNVIRLREAA